jgi:hypothetical protein
MSEAQLQKLENEKVALQAELNSIKQAEAPKQVAGKVRNALRWSAFLPFRLTGCPRFDLSGNIA